MRKRHQGAFFMPAFAGAQSWSPNAKRPRPVFPDGVVSFASVKAYRAFLATSTMAVKAAGSLMAMSDSTLRSSSMPAFFRPFMKEE